MRNSLLFIITLFFFLFSIFSCSISSLPLSIACSVCVPFVCGVISYYSCLPLILLTSLRSIVFGWSFGRGTELIIFCVFKMVLFAHCHLFVRSFVCQHSTLWMLRHHTEAEQCIFRCACVCMSVCAVYYFIMDIKYDWMRVCSTSLFHFVCVCLLLYTCWWAYHDLYAPKPLNIIIITIIYWRPSKMRMKRKGNSRHERLPNCAVAVEQGNTNRIFQEEYVTWASVEVKYAATFLLINNEISLSGSHHSIMI